MGIKLEWAQFSDFDHFNVYRSLSPIDINNPPALIATNLKTMYYYDNSVIENQAYYYQVAYVKGGAEKFSRVIIVKAKSDTISLLTFDTDLTDSMGKIWTPQGSIQVVDGAAVFSGNEALESETSSDFAYGMGDFEWNIEIELNTIAGNQYLIDHGAGNSGTLIYFNNSLKYYNLTTGEYSALYITPIPLSVGVKHAVKVKRASNVTSIYVDDVLKANATDTHNYTAQKVWIGRYPVSGGYFLNGKIHRFEIKNFQ